MKNHSFTGQELAWAAKTSAQLRLIQADFSESSPEERQSYIEQEIRKAVEDILPEQRASYLEALDTHFPLGDTLGAPAIRGSSDSAQASAPVDLSPEALVDRLVKLAPALSRGTLLNLGTRLQGAGFVESRPAAMGEEPPPEFQQRFPLQQGQSIDIQRLFKYTLQLSEFVASMDKLAWNVWRAIAPKSKIRKDTSATGDFRNSSIAYLAGDSEVSIVQIAQITAKLRQLLAGRITASGPAGRSLAQQRQHDLSPAAIKEMAAMESGMFTSVEQKCWRKYVELSAEMTEDVMEAKIQVAIAQYAEDLMRGTAQTPEM